MEKQLHSGNYVPPLSANANVGKMFFPHLRASEIFYRSSTTGTTGSWVRVLAPSFIRHKFAVALIITKDEKGPNS